MTGQYKGTVKSNKAVDLVQEISKNSHIPWVSTRAVLSLFFKSMSFPYYLSTTDITTDNSKFYTQQLLMVIYSMVTIVQLRYYIVIVNLIHNHSLFSFYFCNKQCNVVCVGTRFFNVSVRAVSFHITLRKWTVHHVMKLFIFLWTEHGTR